METKQYVTKQKMDRQGKSKIKWKIPRDKLELKHNDPKPMGCSKRSSEREVYNTTILSQEINEQKSKINLIPKSTRKRITKSQVRRRQEIISLRAEINEIEMNKRIAKIK